MKSNYHTHTLYCGHANGHVIDYVDEAYKKGFDILGMSDHGPLPKFNDRISMNVFNTYIKEIDEAKNKYKDKIKIFKGLEMEYFNDLIPFYYELREKLDYMIFGCHIYYDKKTKQMESAYKVNTSEKAIKYLNNCLEAMETEIFDYIAHPDIFMFDYPKWDETCKYVAIELAKKSVEKNIPLEINANGIRRGIRDTKDGKRYLYPRVEFWREIKKTKLPVKIILGSDCHDPKYLDDESMKEAEVFMKSLNLEIVEELKLKK